MSSNIEFLAQLEDIIRERAKASPDESYTARLQEKGIAYIAQKVGEEGVELALAGVQGDNKEIVAESADLIYHTLVLLYASGLSLSDVSAELEKRHQ
jgi:phosphoribosyl-ATP pyrophosphohydrolase